MDSLIVFFLLIDTEVRWLELDLEQIAGSGEVERPGFLQADQSLALLEQIENILAVAGV